ncbi:hypothetical protein SLS60_009164 [Paraconiothyrium brasiliense]|uniref:Rhodopsin domain-containing protein n=1 Tax=Paraconiothyrium brasiliense TaxID=300254 RepID=A0ABR3QXN7_9PLEO
MLAIVGQLAQWQILLNLGCAAREPNPCNYMDPGGKLLLLLFVQEIFYYVVHWLIKASFLVFYLRLSPEVGFRRLVWIGLAANTVMLIFNELISILQCNPVIAVLRPFEHPEAKCLERLVVFFVPASLNILLDIYILVLPIRVVWALQMPLRRKIAILSVFTFGTSALIVGLVRFHSLLSLNDFTNTAYGVGEMLIVAALEFNLAVVALNLPAMKCLYLQMMGRDTMGGSSGPSNTPDGNKGVYGLSSLGRKAQKQKLDDMGTITRLEQNALCTESEEELWKKGLNAKKRGDAGGMVTKDVTQETSESVAEYRLAENARKYQVSGPER